MVGHHRRKGRAGPRTEPLRLATAAAPVPSVRTASLSSVSPYGQRLGHPARMAHVIWLWMENQPYDAIIRSAQAPYINGLAAQCGLATNSHNITGVYAHTAENSVTLTDHLDVLWRGRCRRVHG